MVDLNEFPSIFQKVQHSRSSHQKPTSKLLRINLNCKLRFNHPWPLDGAMYIYNSMLKLFGGIPKMFVYAVFSKYWWFQTKWFTGLLELLQLYYLTNPIEIIFIFTIYWNYTLALIIVFDIVFVKTNILEYSLCCHFEVVHVCRQ